MPAPGRPAVTMPPLAPNPGAHWAAPSPAGAADQPLVPLAESPRRSGKGKWIGAAAAVALLGAGAGVFAATRGGDKVEAFSLQAAGRQAAASDEVQMTMTMSIGPMEIDAEMIFDDNSGMFQMTMSGEVLGPSATDELTVILDTQNAAAYMGTAAFGDKIPTDAEWVLMDLKELGMNTSQLDQIRSSNPLDIAPLFEEADDVVEVGLDEVNGEKVKHFEVTVDIADVLAAQPDLQEQLDRLGELGGDLTMPDEVTFDVYVNEGSQLRRIVFEMMIGPMNFAADMVVTAIGDSVPPIEVPSGDNLVTFDELMGG
jgi:hypothetical protein